MATHTAPSGSAPSGDVPGLREAAPGLVALTAAIALLMELAEVAGLGAGHSGASASGLVLGELGLEEAGLLGASGRRAVWQRVRAGYYAFDVVRRLPGGERLGEKVRQFEDEQGYGDSPMQQDGWEVQFGSGQWEYMREEAPRYAAVVDAVGRWGGGGAVLDMGCGEGILLSHCSHLPYDRYHGVDISAVAIDRLAAGGTDDRHVFEQGDGDTFEPPHPFDVIVFNESLYYLREPIESLHRYADHLDADGVIVLSTYTASRRALALLRDAKREFEVVEERTTEHGDLSWVCTVLRPQRSGAGG